MEFWPGSGLGLLHGGTGVGVGLSAGTGVGLPAGTGVGEPPPPITPVAGCARPLKRDRSAPAGERSKAEEQPPPPPPSEGGLGAGLGAPEPRVSLVIRTVPPATPVVAHGLMGSAKQT